jgi:hypothetical protein
LRQPEDENELGDSLMRSREIASEIFDERMKTE